MKAQLFARLSLLVVVALLLLAGVQPMAAEPPPPSAVPVTLFPKALARISASGLDSKTVVGIVNTELRLDSTDKPYLKAQVDVLYDSNQAPVALIVYRLRKDKYWVDIAKIILGANYRVVSVMENYVLQPGEYAVDESETVTCPDSTMQVVLSTATTEFPTAVEGINTSYNYAVAAGYKAVKLLGTQENIAAIQNWLSCPNLLYWGRIGHGNTTGVLLYDGMLSYTYFNSLQPSGLKDKVLYFNSCEVFNDPLKSSILGASAAKFVGGICPLWVGPSEQVFKCWNNHNFNHHAPPGGVTDAMCYWSSQCEIETGYPDPGCHGCGGPWNKFPSACTVNLTNNTQNCGGVSPISFIHLPANNKTVFKINLAPSFGYTRARFYVSYTGQPTGWTVNIGDSQSNNGSGGDSMHQSNDAETQILGTALSVYGRDGTPVQPLLNLNNFVSAGSLVPLEVKDQHLGWGTAFGSFMNSYYLYALNGQPDTEGPVNYDIYAAFNRVIYDYPSDRTGTGVGSVDVTLLP